MSFQDALATQPDWVRLWVLWLNIATLGALALCLAARATWAEAAAIFLANLAMVPSMLWLHAEVGFVRLLGLPHLVFWTPLLVWLALRLRRRAEIPRLQRAGLLVYAATLAVSLAFDAADVLRYLLGERASLVPEGA